MLPAERRQHILEMLRTDGKVVATQLSLSLDISEDTIRRDLREMAEAGLLQRVHGGALPRSPTPLPYADRENTQPDAKISIARATIPLLLRHQVILLDGGTTTLQVAKQLPRDFAATIVTNSVPVAATLIDHPSIEIVLLGGRIFKHGRVAMGAKTMESLREIRVDVCVLGVGGLHPEIGITVLDYEEAAVKRTMISSSSGVIAAVSSEKLGTVGPYVVESAKALTHLVTDCDEGQLLPYRNLGIQITSTACSER